MIQISEALSPCVLWVDEIDKAFAGTQKVVIAVQQVVS